MSVAGSRTKRERAPLPHGFGAIWVTVAVDLIGFGVVLPILPQYAVDLHVSKTTTGVIVGSFSLAQLLCAPLLGRLSDRYGRKPVILLSLCGTAVGSVITGLASGVAGGIWLLLLGRVIDGGSGASVSVAQAAAADLATPEERTRLFGLLGAAFGVGFVLGPAIGALAAFFGRSAPFYVAAAIAGVNALLAIRRLPETHGPRATVPKAEAAAQPADHGPPQKVSLRSMPRGVWSLMVVAFVALVAFSGFEATFSLLLQDRFRLGLSGTGGVFTVIGIALVLVQGGAIHPLSAKFSELTILRAGLVLNAIGMLLLAVDGSWYSLVPALVVLVLGQGVVSPTMSSAVAGQVRADQRGQILGYQQSAGSLARFVGPFCAAALYDHVSIPAPYLLAAALIVVAIVLIPRRGAVGRP